MQSARGHPNCDNATRAAETQRALAILGASGWQQLPVRDDDLDADMLAACLRQVEGEQAWDVVFAPAVEDEGHEHHDLVGQLALEVFGPLRCVAYMTYQRGHGRSRSDTEVIPEPGWRALKLRAMAEYASQIELADCRGWFAADDALREFLC